MATLKATQDRVVLLVAKPEGTLPPPPPASDRSVSPQPREYTFVRALYQLDYYF